MFDVDDTPYHTTGFFPHYVVCTYNILELLPSWLYEVWYSTTNA
jgi:hypothetical protein